MLSKIIRGKIFRGKRLVLTQLEKIFLLLMFIAIVRLIATDKYQEISQNSLYLSTKEILPKMMADNGSKKENIRDLDKVDAVMEKRVQKIYWLSKRGHETLDDKIKDANKDSDNINNSQTNEDVDVNRSAEEKPSEKESIEMKNVNNIDHVLLRPSPNTETLNKSGCLQVHQNLQVQKVNLYDCAFPHVIIHHGGQLGNKLCQYISLYLLRHIYGIRVSITQTMQESLGPYFKNISLPIQDFKCFTKNTKRIKYDRLYKNLLSKTKENMRKNVSSPNSSLLDDSYYIFHHPCPREVIANYRDLIREVLVFRDDIMQKAKRRVVKALKYLKRSLQDSTLVTVHVRRKDYTRYILKHYNLTQLSQSYFHRAFDYYRRRVNNPVFVVVSDDQPWCRKVLEGKDVVVAGSKKDPIVDLAILSLGNHHIISYGTFSFMGATLGHGKVVHPYSDNKLYDHYNCVDPKIFVPISRDD